MQSDSDKGASTRLGDAGHLLEVLERYMHRTGARFTDIFSLLDRRVPRQNITESGPAPNPWWFHGQQNTTSHRHGRLPT